MTIYIDINAKYVYNVDVEEVYYLLKGKEL
jgi:hypothetical protein